MCRFKWALCFVCVCVNTHVCVNVLKEWSNRLTGLRWRNIVCPPKCHQNCLYNPCFTQLTSDSMQLYIYINIH